MTGIVNKEQVYRPSSDKETSLTLILNSCQEARMSSILLSLRAEENMTMLVLFLLMILNIHICELVQSIKVYILAQPWFDSITFISKIQSVEMSDHKQYYALGLATEHTFKNLF